MKTTSTVPKTNKNHNSELLFETETETEETVEQPLIETPSVDPPNEPTLELKKKDASRPLYLIRYE